MAVVDDEDDIDHLFKDALSHIGGTNILAFTDPFLALEHFKSNHNEYLALVSDYRMPGMTGIEFLNEVKK